MYLLICDQVFGEERESHTREVDFRIEECQSWPAISDIWLGVRTEPVLSVAKEVAAPARSPTGRGAPQHRQVDAD